MKRTIHCFDVLFLHFICGQEFPYDVQNVYGYEGYASFKIGNETKGFEGYGMGSYSYFRDHDVTVHSGMYP